MLLIVNKVCHVSPASRITRNKFYANLLMFIEWFRTWSHASWIASDKTLARKLLAVLPKATMRKKCGRKKQYRQLTAVSTLLSNTASVGFFFCTPFLFPHTFLLINSISLSFELESSVIFWLTCLPVSGCFLCFFGCCECCLSWIRHAMCHPRRE